MQSINLIKKLEGLQTIESIQKKLNEIGKIIRLELYDLIHDPKEQNNVVDKQPEVASDLRSKLDQWRETRIGLWKIKKHKVEYDQETLDKLRSLGYIE